MHPERCAACDATNASRRAGHARPSDVPRAACAQQSAGTAEAPIAKLPFHPEWGRVLFPEKYEPKPPLEPPVAKPPPEPPVAKPPPEIASPPPPPAPEIAPRQLREPQPVDPVTGEGASPGNQ